MRKLLFAILFTFCFSLQCQADSIIYSNGKVVNCKIKHIVSGMIGAESKEGPFELIRTLPEDQIQDIVDFGIFKVNQVRGEIYYMDNYNLKIKSNNTTYEIRTFKVKNIRLYTN